MNVVVVCPTVRTSAIGSVTLSVLPYLPSEWAVRLWSPALGAQLDTDLAIQQFDAVTANMLDELRRCDLAIYVLGDSPWHRDILRMAMAVPGLVILHDVALTNLLIDLFHHDGRFPDLLDYIETGHGRLVRAQFEHLDPQADQERFFRLMDEVPLVELAVERSLGVVVHSAWAAERVAGLTLGSITVTGLPVPDSDIYSGTGNSTDLARLCGGRDPDETVLMTLGVVNHNRRVDRVLQVLASDAALSRCRLLVAGPVSEPARLELEDMAAGLGIGDRVHILGAVSDADLRLLLSCADGCLVLRDPVLEAASASLLVQMRAHVPVIVYDHGHYGELPPGSVIAVDPAGGAESLTAALLTIARRDTTLQAVRALGAAHASAATPSRYAAALGTAADRALGARPILQMNEVLGDQLARLGLEDRPIIASSIVEAEHELFGLT
jgi:glycosyltransferase involved in cell wall biosynthesis